MPDRQLQLAQWLPYKKDRNADFGGRSFYFFDLDNNILHMDTDIFLFHKEDGGELAITSGELATHGDDIGKRGSYAQYYLDHDHETGSFRNFLDRGGASALFGPRSPLLEDLERALSRPSWKWHGPSWNHFFYAVLNRRPISVITARGHGVWTIRRALNLLHRKKVIYRRPNILSIYPVTNPRLRRSMGDPEYKTPVAELKRRALVKSVEQAFRRYGSNPHHRFGVSDDDPRNLSEITAALVEIKRRYPRNSFFVIDSSGKTIQKTEIFVDHSEASEKIDMGDALNYQLFDF